MQWYAYFAPHTHEQHLDLLAECQLSELVALDRLGATVDGRDLHRLTVGNGPLNSGSSAAAPEKRHLVDGGLPCPLAGHR